MRGWEEGRDRMEREEGGRRGRERRGGREGDGVDKDCKRRNKW